MRTGFLRMAMLLFAGVAPGLVRADELPPLTTPATAEHFPGKFIWADLFTSEPDAAKAFYTGLFGWTATSLERNGHTYYVLWNEGRPVAGIAPLNVRFKTAAKARWVRFISVPDVGRAVRQVTDAGGRIIFPAHEAAQRGAQAVLADPEGALIGVLHSSSGDPGEYLADPGDWVWEELFSADPTVASQLYHRLFAYDAVPDGRVARTDTFLLSSGGYARAILTPVPKARGAHPAWLSFVRVSDLDASVAHAVALGGKVLAEPKPPHPDSRIAILADPLGAAIGLVQLFDEPAPGAAP